MDKRRDKTILFLFFIIVFIVIVSLNSISSSIINFLNDSSTEKNFTGTGSWNNLTYIKIPKQATVSSATLNLTGFSDGSNYPSNVTLDVSNDGDNEYIKTGNETTVQLQTPETENLEDTFEVFSTGTSDSGDAVTMTVGDFSSTSDIYRSYIKFYFGTSDVASITSAELYLYQVSGNQEGRWNVGQDFEIYEVSNQTWNENSCRGHPTLFPCPSIGDLVTAVDVSTFSSTDGVWTNYNVTNWITENSITNGNSNISFMVNFTANADGKTHNFVTKENTTDTSKIPYLNITYLGMGVLNSTESVSDFSSEITSYLSTCSADSEGYCDLPLNISGTDGIVQISAINITYTTPIPNIDITYPTNNTNTTNTQINVNYTLTNISVNSCWWTNNSGQTNNTITCGINITGQTWPEGLNTIKISINNTENQINSSSVTFRLDTTPPTSTITMTKQLGGVYPNNTWTANNINISISASDGSGVGFDNTAYPKYCTDTTNTCDPNTFISSGISFSTEGTSYIRYYSNDTLGNNESIKMRTLKIDKTPPNITITNPTNNTNTTDTKLNINFTVTDSASGVDSCWYSNGTQTSNITLSNCANITTVTWPDGKYNLTIWVNDSVNNINSTAVTFTIDTTIPQISIAFPINLSNYSYSRLNVNYTATDTNLASCWFSNDTMALNTTLAGCGNLTWMNWTDGQHNVTAWANDSAGNTNSSSVTFTIDTTLPLIAFDSTTDTNLTYKQVNNIFINVTASDINRDTLRFSWNGVNETFANSGGNSSWENKTSLTEGAYKFYAWANDSAGNYNETAVRTVYVDLNNPVVNIVHPTASSYSYNTSISLNYTVSDTYLDSCWYNFDETPNITLVSCTNLTDGFNISEATHTLYLYANDSSGRIGNDTVQFTVSLAPPTIVINAPSDNSWLTNATNVYFNYTATDPNGIGECQLWGNWTGTWHRNYTLQSPTNATMNYTAINLTDGVGNIFNVWCNDTGNSGTWGSPSNYTFSIDLIAPIISFGTGTQNDSINTSSTEIYINVSVTETNEGTITFTIHNSTGNFNTTSYTTSTRVINITSVRDGIYTYNVTVNDSAGRSSNTSTRTIRLDDTKPTISITIPAAQNYGTNTTMELNYTATDNIVGLDKCWYYVYNKSGGAEDSLIISTTTLSSCENTTFSLPGGDIDYVLYLFAQDLIPNIQSTSVTFGIRTESPVIVLTTADDTHANNGSHNYFNFTVTTEADSISNCSLWGNWTTGWHLNNSVTTVSESTDTNFSRLTLSEGKFFWNVLCYDNLNNTGWALNNITYIVDLTEPYINVTYITTTRGSQTFYFNTTITDNYLSNTTCKYSIFNSSGGVDGVENISTTCNAQITGTSSAFSTYNLSVYAKDKAGNENSSTKQFTTQTSAAAPGAGITETVTEIQEVFVEAKGVCGNALCEPDLGELFYNCPQDCGGLNIDDLIISCFDDSPEINQKCINRQAPVLFWIAILLIFVTAIAMVTRIPSVRKRLPVKIYTVPEDEKPKPKKKPSLASSWLKNQQRFIRKWQKR